MRMTRLLLKTLRELPADADMVSHQLLLRAGLVTPLAAGLYCFSPVGWRVMQRLEGIVREEMDAHRRARRCICPPSIPSKPGSRAVALKPWARRSFVSLTARSAASHWAPPTKR